MALPPQIDVPEEISREAFDSTLKSFPSHNPIRSVPRIDNDMIPKPALPAIIPQRGKVHAEAQAAGGETLPERQAAPRVSKTKIGTVSSLVEIGAGDL